MKKQQFFQLSPTVWTKVQFQESQIEETTFVCGQNFGLCRELRSKHPTSHKFLFPHESKQTHLLSWLRIQRNLAPESLFLELEKSPIGLLQLQSQDLGLLQPGLTHQAVDLMLKVGCQSQNHVKIPCFQKDQSESAVGQKFTHHLFCCHLTFPRESKLPSSP